MNVFVCGEIQEGKANLLPEEAFHCFKVMRKNPGDLITMIDGKGNFYESEILEISKKSCLTRVTKHWVEKEKGYYLHLAVAPTKNITRYEWFIEKSIEIGIDEITPIHCDHSERNRINLDRLNRIAVGAVKQSLSATFPIINPMISIADFIKIENASSKICAHLDEEGAHLKHAVQAQGSYTILIGPEGDFSKKEIDSLKSEQWRFTKLGDKRLRTETAALVATQIINAIHF